MGEDYGFGEGGLQSIAGNESGWVGFDADRLLGDNQATTAQNVGLQGFALTGVDAVKTRGNYGYCVASPGEGGAVGGRVASNGQSADDDVAASGISFGNRVCCPKAFSIG